MNNDFLEFIFEKLRNIENDYKQKINRVRELENSIMSLDEYSELSDLYIYINKIDIEYGVYIEVLSFAGVDYYEKYKSRLQN